MPIKNVTSFELSCDMCDYVAETDDGEISLFDSPYGAVAYARDSGWMVKNADEIFWFACGGCQ
jgi:hypothetical protein